MKNAGLSCCDIGTGLDVNHTAISLLMQKQSLMVKLYTGHGRDSHSDITTLVYISNRNSLVGSRFQRQHWNAGVKVRRFEGGLNPSAYALFDRLTLSVPNFRRHLSSAFLF